MQLFCPGVVLNSSELLSCVARVPRRVHGRYGRESGGSWGNIVTRALRRLGVGGFARCPGSWVPQAVNPLAI